MKYQEIGITKPYETVYSIKGNLYFDYNPCYFLIVKRL